MLSGKDGSKISRTLADSIGSQSSPLSISVRGRGNDVFVHWLANCKGHDKERLVYSFPSGESMHDQMRADVCHALFGTQQEATLLALSRFNESAESVIYSSLYWDSFEHANATNTSAMAFNYVNQNPNKESEYKASLKDNDYSVIPKVGDDFHDVFAELEKQLALDPNKVAFAESADAPVEVGNVLKSDRRNKGEETVPNIGYNQPHSVKKYPTELGANQQDNFENPYARQQQYQMPVQQPVYPQQPQYPQYPQYPPAYPQYPQGGYGRRRRKRAVPDYDAHWGIHRIMSTGMYYLLDLSSDRSLSNSHFQEPLLPH